MWIFKRIVQFLEQFTPEAVEKITRCPAENIMEAARLLGTQGPTMCLWTMGLISGLGEFGQIT